MEKKIRVYLLTTSFPRWKNDGRSPFILEKAKSLTEEGIDVTVVAMHSPGAEEYEVLEGVKVRRIKYFPEKWEILQETRAGIPDAWRKNKITLILIVNYIFNLSLFLILNRKRFDLVHANWTISALSAVITKIFHKKSIITSFHGSDINQATNNYIFRVITKFVIFFSNEIICVSSDLRNQILNFFSSPTQIVVIPNGVNTDFFFPDYKNKEKIILFVGSLTKNKRVDLIIDSFSNIIENYKNYLLMIIGDGVEEKKLKSIAEKKLPVENYKFTGSLPRSELSMLMRKATVLILPSMKEGFGVVLIEAMASGVPCIGAETGGIVDIISEEVGLLFPVGDKKGLEFSLLSMLKDKDLIKMSKEARNKAENIYSWKIISKLLVREYKKNLKID